MEIEKIFSWVFTIFIGAMMIWVGMLHNLEWYYSGETPSLIGGLVQTTYILFQAITLLGLLISLMGCIGLIITLIKIPLSPLKGKDQEEP